MTRSPICVPVRPKGFRPLCPCCEGGFARKGKSYCKAKSRRLSARAKKPRTFSRESIRFLRPVEPFGVLATISPDWSN